jgi:hypothetical protein
MVVFFVLTMSNPDIDIHGSSVIEDHNILLTEMRFCASLPADRWQFFEINIAHDFALTSRSTRLRFSFLAASRSAVICLMVFCASLSLAHVPDRPRCSWNGFLHEGHLGLPIGLLFLKVFSYFSDGVDEVVDGVFCLGYMRRAPGRVVEGV